MNMPTKCDDECYKNGKGCAKSSDGKCFYLFHDDNASKHISYSQKDYFKKPTKYGETQTKS